jgi:Tfp pilus assembly protein PilW
MTSAHEHCEAGVTLVELLVALMLTSIIGVIVSSALIQATQVTARANNSTTSENDARLALRTVSEDVRAAVQIQAPASAATCPTGSTYPAGFSTCVQFLVPHEVSAVATTTTVASGADPIECPFSKLTYGVKGGVLREDRTDYNASCQPVSGFTGKTILSGVDNSASQPVFVFYDGYGNRLGSTDTLAKYSDARSVSIQIWLNYQKNAPDVSLMTTAALRNNR